MRPFVDRLIEAIEQRKSVSVVGLDPDPELLPPSLLAGGGVEPARTLHAISRFHQVVLEIAAGRVPVVKPQVAFYERFGPAGMEVFRETLTRARDLGLLTIADVKRGDVPGTAKAYASAYFGPSAGFPADAVTLSPYLGGDSLKPWLDAAQPAGGGVFLLVRTSNPGARDLQDLVCGSTPLYMEVARRVREWSEALVGRDGWSGVGAVVGATYPEEGRRLREALPRSFFLVPGYGAQGGKPEDLRGLFGVDGLGALVSASRSAVFPWHSSPWKERFGPSRWERAIEAAIDDMNQAIAAVRPGR